jgi:pimeloyl-ACP methyl ester carboxylesterase
VIIDILDGLQKEEAVLMGKSWGGGVAVKTAVSYPERISKLVLTAPALRNFDQLSQISQQVLLTWAEDDPVIPVTMSSEFTRRVKDIEYISYPTGGHSAAMKNAEDFAPHLVDFLNGEL